MSEEGGAIVQVIFNPRGRLKVEVRKPCALQQVFAKNVVRCYSRSLPRKLSMQRRNGDYLGSRGFAELFRSPQFQDPLSEGLQYLAGTENWNRLFHLIL